MNESLKHIDHAMAKVLFCSEIDLPMKWSKFNRRDSFAVLAFLMKEQHSLTKIPNVENLCSWYLRKSSKECCT